MASSGIFDLDRNLVNVGFLDGNRSLSVGITNQTNPLAVQKITTNAPLNADEFIVDNIEATASANASGINFLTGRGSVGFQASGDAYAELAVFPDSTSASFATALGPISDTKFSLPLDTSSTVAMLRWGADAKASGNGSIALGSGLGTIDFSAGGSAELFFAVLRQVPRTTLTDDALATVVSSWRLPSQVRTANDLLPHTHILSEVGGSLKASISATFGHEFNWMRQISAGALDGSIGLKLQLGLTAGFALNTQGKYAVAVSRETDAPVIRVRIYKLKLNGFDFSLTAGVSATPSVPLPDKFDDLVKATLGVHALQILDDLEDPTTIDRWISKFGSEYVGDLLKKFTGLDLAAAITKVQDLAARWQSLPNSVASLFVKFAGKVIPDFTDILQVSKLIASSDTNGLKTFLENKLQNLNVPLLSSPLGQYLESLGEASALSLLQNIPQDVKDAAQKTVDFLSGAPIESLLNGIVTDLDTRLGLDAILKDLQGADPASVLDKLLFSKLEAFLDKTPVVQDIQKLQAAIKALVGKVSSLYEKTVKALTSTYAAQLNATYQRTTTDTALIDASFDFGVADTGPVQAALANLMGGNLDDFLTNPVAGVELSSGTLTHSIKRNAHVDLTLPFLTVSGDWITNAVATFNAIDENDGRLTTYQLDVTGTQISKNTFTSLWTGRNWRSTSIAMSAQIVDKIPSSTALRVFADTAGDRKRLATTTASIRLEVSKLSLSQLEAGVEPFAVQFLRRAFPDNNAFERWAKTGNLLPTPGNTLVSMDVVVPPAVPLAWLNNTVSNKGDAIYKQLSLTLQFPLRRYLRDYYFRDLTRFQDLSSAFLVLLYAALPPANAIKVDGNTSSVEDGTYWDTQDINAVRGMANLALASKTAQGFKGQFDQAHARLMVAGQTDLANRYDTSGGLTSLFNTAASDLNMGMLKNSLLLVESRVISGAHSAALNAAAMNSLIAANRPVEALKMVTAFGNQVADAFNADLSSVFVRDNDALQRIAALIFAQAASVFDPTVPTGNFDSTLNVTVLRPGAQLPEEFPDFTVNDNDVLVSLNAASFSS